MKKIILSLIISTAFIACKKDDEVKPEIPEVNNPTVSCGERKICFDIEDSSYTSNVGMYHLDDTSYFAKYESNGQQLSIDWFTQDPMVGSFPAGNVKMKGKSRIYWFPDATTTYWMSDSGEVKITKHEGNKVSATFNGRLQKLVNGSPNGEVLFVKNGVFTDGSYF